MTIGIKDLVDQINSEIDSPANDSTRVAQLSGSTTFNTYSVATIDALPLASENTGRFILVLSSDSYYFSDGTKWTNKVESTIGTIIAPWVWGDNAFGLLGDNTVIDKSSPISFIYNNFGWSNVEVSSCSAVGIRNDCTAWAWGCNGCGQLGDGTTLPKSSPILIAGGFTDWCDISVGDRFSGGIRTNGTMWAWGCNNVGQLGDNTVVNKSSPVSVVGGLTDWCDITLGCVHAVGLRKNGTIWAWGCNSKGQLGDNTTVNKSSPIPVAGGFTDWSKIDANRNTFGIRSNGTLWSWGYNRYGQIGDGTTISRSSPVSIVGGFTDWSSVSSGNQHAVATRQDGTAWTWGSNGSGALGDGSGVDRSSPVSVVGGFVDWCNIAAGGAFSTGVRMNGTAWSWGLNNNGQLGDNTVVNKSSPVSVVGGFTDWYETRAGLSGTSVFFRYSPKGF